MTTGVPSAFDLPFEERCKVRVQAVCAELGLKILRDFERILGETEDYWTAVVLAKGISIEVFVYNDEAGLMLPDDNWHPFERPDYRGDEDLIRALETDLRKLAT